MKQAIQEGIEYPGKQADQGSGQDGFMIIFEHNPV